MTDGPSEQQQRATRILLKKPLLRAVEVDAFRAVRPHVPQLRTWFELNTGWRLHADSDVIRLLKEPSAPDDPTRPAVDPRSKAAFSRRRYILFCLALAALERADAQIPLGRLAEQVMLLAHSPVLEGSGVEFTLAGREQKADLVAAVRLLLELGVLTRVAGDEEDYLRDTGDVLYDISRRVLSQLLASRRGPSTIDAPTLDQQLAALSAPDMFDSHDMRNRRIRHRLTRRLLDDPVLYFDELDEHEAEYLRSQRSAIIRRISEQTGLVGEIRGEGIAMVDPDDDLTDVKMPDTGTGGHVTLLLAEALAAEPDRVHSMAELHERTRRLVQAHKGYWRKTAQEPGAEVALAGTAVGRLEALRLAERREDGVRALPALARFAVAEPVVRGAGPS
ncbi:TIGR02678 family protein [Phytoactinopolyspora mesophila]|uniref:TIGR02678 family protein n=1 Tax=Phytoactinopolyspora mesophila TaxID=2650750 RepID=A0A7K3LZX1_9ACTN|nr:TIGR02678 family protein [Phytoactinopolyspora mesophila]NDL55758.1 TIGR02678 family protein [Phytoactinopolyspora mesophila]